MADPDLSLESAFFLLDAGLRGAAIALLLLAVLIFARAPRSLPRRFGIALCLCAMAAALDGLPQIPALNALYLVLAVGGNAAIPMFWLFSHALFDDEYRLTVRDVALAVGFVVLQVVVGLGTVGAVPKLPGLPGALVLGGVGFAFHAQWLAWRSRHEDLVEPRRRVRTAFILIVGAIILWSIGSDLAGRLANQAALSRLSGAVALFAGTLAIAASLFGLSHPDIVAARAVTASPTFDPPPSEPGPADRALATALDRIMAVDRAYREPDLTIGSLAARLGTQEHRLRRLINGTLGHRNVNAFLNDLRIGEVRTALADPAQSEVPILTMAMDAGFGSLAVFNRAFKDRLGETPTAFRLRHLALQPALGDAADG